MSAQREPTTETEATRQRLAPMGKPGFRGRSATPEERSQIRRIPYLQQYFVLMLLSATIAVSLGG